MVDALADAETAMPVPGPSGRDMLEVDMNVRVDENRFLSVACEPEERVVFDRLEKKYHLLRESAARLWDEIGEGGAFDLATVTSEEDNPIAPLVEAGLVSIDADQSAARAISRRVWLARTGKASAAAIVLPLVATIATPRFVLGQDVSVEDLNDPGLDAVEQKVEETQDLTKLTSRERRRLRREEKKKLELEKGEELIEPPTIQEPTTTRSRRRNRDDTPIFEEPTNTTPTSLFREEEKKEENTSTLNQFFRRRYGD